MRLISSKPSRWALHRAQISLIGLLGCYAYIFMVFLRLIANGSLMWQTLSFGVLGAMVSFLIWDFYSRKKFTSDLADEVWEADDHLVVKIKGIDQKILFSDVQHVQYMAAATSPSKIILTLDAVGQLGRKIAFFPPAKNKSDQPVSVRPLATELIDKIALARPS